MCFCGSGCRTADRFAFGISTASLSGTEYLLNTTKCRGIFLLWNREKGTCNYDAWRNSPRNFFPMSQRELNSHPCHYPKELKLRPTRLKAEPFAKPDGDGASLDFSISLCMLAIRIATE